MTTAMAWTDRLRAARACREAVTYAEGYPSFQAAWDVCERGDWMLWWIGRTVARARGPERRRVVRVACACARLALPYVSAGEERPLVAIETAERWATGDASISLAQVRTAAAAAAAAAASSSAAYAAYAAAAAAAYAAAAYAAAAAAARAAAADAAYAAAAYAYDAAAAARTSVLRQCADLVRAEYPRVPGEERGRHDRYRNGRS